MRLLAILFSFLFCLPASAQFGYSPTTTRFGGTGADGDVTIAGAVAYTAPVQKNAKKFVVNASQTLTINTAAPFQLCALGPVTINGTITANGTGYPGGAGSIANASAGGNGAGPGGGCGVESTSSTSGGGGGGFGGVGGNSGAAADGGAGRRCRGGATYAFDMLGGSGGAGGQGNFGAGVGGAGGAGGGTVLIQSTKTITISSTGVINCNGSNGAAGAVATSGGGGAGSGGLVFLASQTGIVLSASGQINCNGGNGGNGNGGGGGGSGGGGRWGRWYPTGTLTVSGAFSSTTGTGGTGNGGVGAAGSTFDIVGVPNNSLSHWLFEEDGMRVLLAMADAHYKLSKTNSFVISQRELARVAAAGDERKFVSMAGE